MTFIKVPASALKIGDIHKCCNVRLEITELERTATETRVLLRHIRYGTQTQFSWHNHEKVKIETADCPY